MTEHRIITASFRGGYVRCICGATVNGRFPVELADVFAEHRRTNGARPASHRLARLAGAPRRADR